ncbi:MAG: hypothetical protein JWO41_386 [Candidatus Saccharibacteria bacterium]|nr:hypothetical protein [Candidatus Saccharibacteria bacterium]
MATQYAPFSPEHRSSPEDQAVSIRMMMIQNADALFNMVPVPAGAIETPTEAQRVVPRQVTNPIVNHVMNQPTMGEAAQDIIDEIYGQH